MLIISSYCILNNKSPLQVCNGDSSYYIQKGLVFFLHLFLMLLDQSLLDIVRHELVA